MKKKFKFQRKNGCLFEGSFEIVIRDHIAEINKSDLSPAILYLIEANGGQEVIEKPELKPKPKLKPKKEEEKEILEETERVFGRIEELIDKGVKDGSTNT